MQESFINQKVQDLMRCLKELNSGGVDYSALLTDILAQLRVTNDFEETVWVDKNTGGYYIREKTLNQGTGLFTISWKFVDGTAANPTIANLEQIKSVSDYELVSTDYRATVSGVGYIIGDIIKSVTIIDTSDNSTTTLWRNETQNTNIATPSMPHLQPIGDAVLLNGNQRTRISNGINDVAVQNTDPIGGEYGLVTRNIPSGVQEVDITNEFIQEDFGTKAAKNVLVGGEYIEGNPQLNDGQGHAFLLDVASQLKVTDELSQEFLSDIILKLSYLATEDTLVKLNNKFIVTLDGIKTQSVIVDSNGDIIDNFVTPLAIFGAVQNIFLLVSTANVSIDTTNVLSVVLRNVGTLVATFSWNGRVRNLQAGQQWFTDAIYDYTSNKYTPIGILTVNGNISEVEVDRVYKQ